MDLILRYNLKIPVSRELRITAVGALHLFSPSIQGYWRSPAAAGSVLKYRSVRVGEVAKELGVRPKVLVRFLEEWSPREDGKRWDVHHTLGPFHLDLIKSHFSSEEYTSFNPDLFLRWIEETLGNRGYPYKQVRRLGSTRIIVELEGSEGEVLQLNVSDRGFMLEAKDRESWEKAYTKLEPYKSDLYRKGFYLIPKDKVKPSKLDTYGIFYLHYNSSLFSAVYESDAEPEIRTGVSKTLELMYSFMVRAGIVRYEPSVKLLLRSLKIERFRRLKFEEPVLLDRANVIVGENDSGKTSLLLGILFYLKAIKLLATDADSLYTQRWSGRKWYGKYVSKEFFSPLSGSDTLSTVQALFWRNHVRGDTVNVQIVFEGRFRSADRDIEVDISLRIAYRNRTLHILVDEENFARIREFRKFFSGINVIYMEKSVSPKGTELYMGEGDQLKPYILKNLYDMKHDEVIRTLALYFGKRLGDIVDSADTDSYFRIFEIRPRQDEWKQHLLIRYEDTDIDRVDLKDEKDVKRYCMEMGLEDTLKEFTEHLRRNSLSLSGQEYAAAFRKFLEERPLSQEERERKYIEIANVGQGVKDIIYLTLLLHFLREAGASFLLIDEPFLHMHPHLKSKTVDYIINLCDRFNIQIFYTTHDPKLIPERKSSTSFVIVDRKEKSVVRNEESIERIFRFLETLGYIEVIFRRLDEVRKKRKLLLVEGFSDKNLIELIFDHHPLYRGKFREYLVLPISSSEVVPILPVFFGSLIPAFSDREAYSYTEFREGLREAVRSSVILLDADYKASVDFLRKSYEEWVRESTGRFFSALSGKTGDARPVVRVMPFYSIENLVLVPSLLKSVFGTDRQRAAERVAAHVEENKDQILKQITANIIRLKEFLKDPDLEGSSIKHFRNEIEMIGVEGLARKCLENIRRDPLKFYRGKKVIEILSGDRTGEDVVSLTAWALRRENRIAEEILREMEAFGFGAALGVRR